LQSCACIYLGPSLALASAVPVTKRARERH